ncbi:MAG: ATP-dependent DNA helicase [Planctomycetes bacterium]|nr:ATP-dependent DNA helicase [Planctomycetota bacterium]
MPDAQDAYLDDLTDPQREAVLHGDGPLLILAGPGSGKTRVITRRIAHLIRQGVRPQQILAMTFTNKAAAEMRQRVWQQLSNAEKEDPFGVILPPHRMLRVSTFHSFGVYFLRVHRERLDLDKNFTIYDQSDRNKMVRSALQAAGLDNGRITPDAVESAISRAKNQLLTADQYARQAGDYFSQVVAQVYPIYEKKMREANALDFDDLLFWPALALKSDEELRADVDARYRYVLVDEYQDTNKAQYEIVRRLCQDERNLCVVGDPDQSIYKWRGSDIKNILDFERDYPDARIITLEENFRSTRAILMAADSLIAHNRQRKPKRMTTHNAAGAPARVLSFETGLEEAEGIARQIREAVQSGRRRYRDFAVFMRVNALSRNLETELVKQRVPFQMVRGLAFFERKENRDVLAYLRLLVNPRDNLSFARVVNEPPRGIGKVSLDHLAAYAEPRELSLLDAAAQADKIPAIKGRANLALRGFARLIQELTALLDQPADEVIRQVIERSGYGRMLENSGEQEDQDRLANIEELITAAKQFVAEDPERTIVDFLENITLASDVDSWDEKQDCVSVMTLHAAKGLEFPAVYILAMEQGLLPHERSTKTNEDLEEERRLAFVGMTRAQEELSLCHSRLREFRGQTMYAVPSMFLEEIPSDIVETVDLSSSGARKPRPQDIWRGEPTSPGWKEIGLPPKKRDSELAAQLDAGTATYAAGMVVRHEQYGMGKITHVSGYGAMRKLKIRFATAGERSFMAGKAKLEIMHSHT